jgi:S-methylmethionine-dependent homocysteine/selenocysteine methylase
MRQLCEMPGNQAVNTKIGGLLGCKNDCYRPEQGLSAADAETFHRWQINQLAQGGVDFLIAETLPNVEEAVGIGRALAESGLPYFISFVISRGGRVLDGTSVSDAISRIDEQTDPQPLGYLINCAYPTFLQAAAQPKIVFNRLVGYLANASSLDQAELDEADMLQSEDITDWGERMLELNRCYGVQILGGCCGTTHEHLRYLVRGRVQREAR